MDLEGPWLAYGSLIAMAVAPIYVGSWRATRSEEKEHISSDDAKYFPLYGSATLFGLYLLFRYLPPEYVNLILSSYVVFMALVALVNLLYPLVSKPILALFPPSEPFHARVSRGTHVYLDVKFDWAHLILCLPCGALSIYYAVTKNWILNNILGEAFSLGAIQLLHLDSFNTGIILLSGLFIYDIFWVFGTEVMVTVAKSFDAPIKVVFPRDIFADEFKFAMLGLGDIVIPGVFVALALRFDLSRAKAKKSQGTPYFTACFTAYFIGLLTTMLVMQIFKAAQPALLYLSPACVLSVLFTAYRRGELKELFAYAPNEQRETTLETKKD